MLNRILRVKLQELTVTESSIEYPGSLSLPESFFKSCSIHEFEQVYVNNKTNGNRISTYVVKNKSINHVTVNGAASKLFAPGDKIHVLIYSYVDENEISGFSPQLIITNGDNNIVEIKNYKECW